MTTNTVRGSKYRLIISLIITVLKYNIRSGLTKMNEGISSIQSGANDDRDDCLGGLKANAIQAAEFTPRLRLRAAVSLASLMTVSAASAQEGGTSGLQLPTIDVTGDQGGYQATQQSINRLQTPLLKAHPTTVGRTCRSPVIARPPARW